MQYLKWISQYLLRDIGSYLDVQEIVVLSAVSPRLRDIFGSIHNIYERECKRIYSSELELYK